MKKLMLILMAVTLCLPSAMSQNKQIEKERAKVYKAKLKEFTKEGWKVYPYDALNRVDAGTL